MKYYSTLNETEKYWFKEGLSRGTEIASYYIQSKEDKNGETHLLTNDGLLPWGKAIENTYEIEHQDRDFSPFEFTAKELNSHNDSKELWEAYDTGISEGILSYAENLEMEAN